MHKQASRIAFALALKKECSAESDSFLVLWRNSPVAELASGGTRQGMLQPHGGIRPSMGGSVSGPAYVFIADPCKHRDHVGLRTGGTRQSRRAQPRDAHDRFWARGAPFVLETHQRSAAPPWSMTKVIVSRFGAIKLAEPRIRYPTSIPLRPPMLRNKTRGIGS